jgi:N-acetylmuramoyl-L-alanine amidase
MNGILYGLIAVIFFYGYIVSTQPSHKPVKKPSKKVVEEIVKETPEPHFTDKDVQCLAKNIYYEARGEDLKEQISVGQVVLNRTKDSRYPSSICGVVYQPYQFSWTNNKPHEISEWRAWRIAKTIAKDLLANRIVMDYTNGATHYHTRNIKPKWSRLGSDKIYLASHVYMKMEY